MDVFRAHERTHFGIRRTFDVSKRSKGHQAGPMEGGRGAHGELFP